MSIRVVMISSTALDLPRHREQVMSACLEQNLFPKMMEHLPASDANAINASMQLVNNADIYVGVIGFRYGYVPRKHSISITEMEYRRAGQRGIPRLMFLMSEEHALRATDVETGAGAEKLHAFRQRISAERVIAKFISPEDLRGRVVQALGEFRVDPDRQELVASQIGSARYRIAVLNQAKTVSMARVETVVKALQTQVSRDLAPTWGVDAQIELFGPGQTPPETAWWLYLDDDSKFEGLLGYHAVNAAGLPLARVGVRSAEQAGKNWSHTASHTLLQLLVNPKGNVAVFEQGKFFPQEICRPCGGDRWAYEIDSVKVSDFVLPAWFDSYRKPGSTRFDFRGSITAPFEVLPGGYVFHFQNADSKTVFAPGKPIRLVRAARRKAKASTKHPR